MKIIITNLGLFFGADTNESNFSNNFMVSYENSVFVEHSDSQSNLFVLNENLIANLKCDVLKTFLNIFAELETKYEFKLKSFTDIYTKLIAEIATGYDSNKDPGLTAIKKSNKEFQKDSQKLKENINIKKDCIVEIFNTMFDELLKVINFSKLSFSSYLIRYNSFIEILKDKNKNIKKRNILYEGFQQEPVREIEENMHIGVEKKIKPNKTFITKLQNEKIQKLIQHMPIEVNKLRISEKKEPLNNLLKDNKDSNLKKYKVNYKFKCPKETCNKEDKIKNKIISQKNIPESKQKTDAFIVFLIELCKNIIDKEKQKEIINNIILEGKICNEDLKVLIRENNIDISCKQNTNPLFISRVAAESHINRSQKGITISLDYWNKIKNNFSAETADQIYSLNFLDTFNKNFKSSYIHIISDLLEFDHSTVCGQIDSVKIERHDLYPNILNKNFNICDPTTYNLITNKRIKDLSNLSVEVCENDCTNSLCLLYALSATVNTISFLKIPSLSNKSTILSCFLKDTTQGLVYIPQKQIIMSASRIFDMYFVNLFKNEYTEKNKS
ncbi:hypothetical protein NUSPORA_01439 [Nucleospora cyclopteri]